jgi:rhamnopyranosyl-N-acetylglucosaminyl-diphospho-decaprenol beta-1,3/1,4-galactofuranosyltransferase
VRVAAVVLDPPCDATRRPDVLAAIEAQSRPVEEALRMASEHGRAVAVRRALESSAAAAADWIWLLDAGVVPQPDALDALLAPLDSMGTLVAPLVMSGKVMTEHGSVDAAAAPWPRLTDKETAIEAAAHRLVSIRAARHGSLLVHRSAIERYGLPRADYVTEGDDLEWTGRILKRERGYLVPRSVAFRRGPVTDERPERRYRDMRNRVDMLRRDVWDGDERLWFGLMIAQDLVRELGPRARRSSRAVILRAVRDGLTGRS